MNDAERAQIKRDLGEQLGVEISDEDIDHATEAANQAVQRKKVELEQLPLRRHLYQHHYAGPTLGLDLKTMQLLHETAPQQGSHPDE